MNSLISLESERVCPKVLDKPHKSLPALKGDGKRGSQARNAPALEPGEVSDRQLPTYATSWHRNRLTYCSVRDSICPLCQHSYGTPVLGCMGNGRDELFSGPLMTGRARNKEGSSGCNRTLLTWQPSSIFYKDKAVGYKPSSRVFPASENLARLPSCCLKEKLPPVSLRHTGAY